MAVTTSMLRRAPGWAAVFVVGLIGGMILVQPGAAAPPEEIPAPDTPVLEQNLDGDGYIAVHEQGTANVNVTGGSMTVGGTIAATQSGTWSIGVSNFPPVQPVSGTVGVGNEPTVDARQLGTWQVDVATMPSVSLATNSTIAVVNPTSSQPLLVQEVGATSPSLTDILPPTGNTIIGPALLEMDIVGSYAILRGDVSLNFCITAVHLNTNGNASFQANPTTNATWYNFRYGNPLARCETNKQNANIDNHVAGTSLVYRIDAMP